MYMPIIAGPARPHLLFINSYPPRPPFRTVLTPMTVGIVARRALNRALAYHMRKRS